MLASCHQGQECKRQLAILFSFLEEDQPSDLIEGILGDVDNGQVSSLVIADPGGGYTGSVPEVKTPKRHSPNLAVAHPSVLLEFYIQDKHLARESTSWLTRRIAQSSPLRGLPTLGS